MKSYLYYLENEHFGQRTNSPKYFVNIQTQHASGKVTWRRVASVNNKPELEKTMKDLSKNWGAEIIAKALPMENGPKTASAKKPAKKAAATKTVSSSKSTKAPATKTATTGKAKTASKKTDTGFKEVKPAASKSRIKKPDPLAVPKAEEKKDEAASELL